MTPRRRVLIVDDESDLADLLAASLPPREFAVDVTTSPADALEHAATGRPEIALLDVNMPGMNGFQLRDRLRALPGLTAIPVVFVTGAESPFEMEIARELGGDSLLIKPVPRVELRRSICSALGMVRNEEGAMPAILDRLLFSIAENGETGILIATRPGISKRVVFHEGRIVFASSNDPRDMIGQTMLRAGMISEKDLLEAFAVTNVAPPRLQTALMAMRKITPEQSRKAFEMKIRESVLDIFLWNDGHGSYLANGVEGEEIPFPLSLTIAPIRAEGVKRRRRWREVMAVLPAQSGSFERIGEWPEHFPQTPGDQLLAAAVERGETLERILLEFRGQNYPICVRLADLIHRGALVATTPGGFVPEPALSATPFDSRVSEIPSGEFTAANPRAAPRPGIPVEPAPAAPPPRPAPSEWTGAFEKAVEVLRAGDPSTARLMLLEVANGDPTNPLVAARISEAEAEIEMAARAMGLKDDVAFKLNVSMQSLMNQKLSPAEAFLLSRFAAGPMMVGEMVMVCPFPPFEVLSILQRFAERALIRKVD